MATNEEILEAFYCEYFRSPKLEEFKACGGKIIEKGKYNSMIVSYGYPKVTNCNTYEVISDETGEIVFTGTTKDIAEEFDVPDSDKISWAAKINKLFRRKYRIRLKPFDAELVRKELEK